MKIGMLSVAALGLVVGAAAYAQDAGTSAPGQDQSQGQGGGQRGGRGFGGMGMGRGVMGTVTEATPDHFTVKTETGDVYTIHFSANTRLMKQPAGGGRGQGQAQGGERPMPQPIKAADIKAGDAIVAGGEVDAAAKSVGATFVMQLDPERAKQMLEMQANYGKTWLAGKVMAVNETKVTIEGGMDNTTHTFMADENTTFRKRRDPITMADMQVGDNVRVDGAVKDGTFVATTVNVMTPPMNGGQGQRGGPPQSTPPQN